MNEHLPYNENLLIQYIDGTMNEQECRKFEKTLRNNKLLGERIQQLRIVVESVRQHGTRSDLNDVREESAPSLMEGIFIVRVAAIKKIGRFILAVVASTFLLLVLTRIFSTSNTAAIDLYNQAFVDYNVSDVFNSGRSSAAEKAYQKNNYTSVISHSNSDSLSEKDSLLTGITLLKTEQPSLAIHWLSPLTDHGAFREDAAFYLSLSYLKNKDFKQAYSLMQQIHSAPSNVYHAQFPDEYLKKVKELDWR